MPAPADPGRTVAASSAGRILLMSASALVMTLFGLIATFLPQELLTLSGSPATGAAPLLVQLLGTLYLAFAAVNWMGRTNLIGGIYSRPIAMGNALHFTMGALALLKGVMRGTTEIPVLAALVCYALFSLAFLLVLFRHPRSGASAAAP